MISILFARPDLNSTFALSKSLEKLDVKNKIFLGINYPEMLIFDQKKIIGKRFFNSDKLFLKLTNSLINFIQFLFYAYKFNYIIYYGRPPVNNLFKKFFKINNFSLELFILKRVFQKKIIYNPSGCNEEFLKKDFMKYDLGNVCGNCGFFDKCNDELNQNNFNLINKYFDLKIGFGFISSNKYLQEQFKFKSIDINLFSPNIKVPNKFKLRDFDGLTIYHSSFIKNSGRFNDGKDIKGSKYIIDALDKLIDQGYKIRKLLIDDIPMKDLRFFQVQADIAIDQLIYGTYGSTAIECMALGKPVISYLNPIWKKSFLENFREHNELPIIEANTQNIFSILKEILDNPSSIKEIGKNSRNFVLKQYNPDINSKILIEKLDNLK